METLSKTMNFKKIKLQKAKRKVEKRRDQNLFQVQMNSQDKKKDKNLNEDFRITISILKEGHLLLAEFMKPISKILEKEKIIHLWEMEVIRFKLERLEQTIV